MMIVFTDSDEMLAIPFESLPETHEQRRNLLFAYGAKAGQKIPGISEVYFITEAWMSRAKKKFVQPAKDPRRKEVLIINCCDLASPDNFLVMYEMKRDKRGNLTELTAQQSELGEKVDSPLLNAFRSGYQLGQSGHADEFFRQLGFRG